METPLRNLKTESVLSYRPSIELQDSQGHSLEQVLGDPIDRHETDRNAAGEAATQPPSYQPIPDSVVCLHVKANAHLDGFGNPSAG